LFEHFFQVGLKREEPGYISFVGGEMCRVARGKKAPHSFRFSIAAEHLENIFPDQSSRFGGIMRRASDAHRADGRAGKSFGVSVAGSATQRAPFSMKGSPGTLSQQDIRMLFVISAASIPGP
jgi:hypothetical protein